MSRFNGKEGKPRTPDTINEMGEGAYLLEKKEELVATVLTTFLGENAYYETGQEILKRVVDCAEVVPVEFVAKLALYARNEGNMRSCSHLLAALVIARASGKPWVRRFYQNIVLRPDDMAEIIGAYTMHNNMALEWIKRIPNAMKYGFREALEQLDPYQIDKYKMKGLKLNLIDLVRICHPRPTEKNAEAYRRLIKGESLGDLYDSKILEKEMSETGKGERTKEEIRAAKREAIVSVMENERGGMPMMNLLRNLNNILEYAPDKVEEACTLLTTQEKIEKSRLLPFRFASAYREVEKGLHMNDRALITFEKDEADARKQQRLRQRVLNALEKAIELSCRNIPRLPGNVAILIDHSGSVRGDSGGPSKVSAFSKTTGAMVGNLFGSMLAYSQENVYIGLFGDRLISVPVDRSMGVLAFNQMSYQMGAKCGASTETGIYEFMRNAIKQEIRIDNLVVFSDCQIGTFARSDGRFTDWYGLDQTERSPMFQELFAKFRKLNPECRVVVVNIYQVKGNTVFDKSERITNIAGWSSKIFDFLAADANGMDALTKEIDKISL